MSLADLVINGHLMLDAHLVVVLVLSDFCEACAVCHLEVDCGLWVSLLTPLPHKVNWRGTTRAEIRLAYLSAQSRKVLACRRIPKVKLLGVATRPFD